MVTPGLLERALKSDRLQTLSLRLIQQMGLSPIADAKLDAIDHQLAAK